MNLRGNNPSNPSSLIGSNSYYLKTPSKPPEIRLAVLEAVEEVAEEVASSQTVIVDRLQILPALPAQPHEMIGLIEEE